MCDTCNGRARAARDLVSGKARTWSISLADGTSATVSSDSEATRLQRQARARMAQKGYTAKRG
jgi:hypothetical protein